MKIIKKIAIVFIIICLIYIGQSTYSKYKDQISGNTNIEIATWKIIVNEENISGKTELSKDITPTLPGNEYIKEGVLAPGAEGYYDIIIDCSNIDVAFNYSISASPSEESAIKDLIITGYEINPTEEQNILEYNDKITNDINYDVDSITIRIYIKWDDGDTSTMDNTEDTEITLNHKTISFTNYIEFNQIKEK